MIKEANNRDDFHLPYLQSLLNELIIMILRNCRYVTANKVNANFNAIVDYIKNHYKESITLKSVADKFYMNSSYLSRIFKKNTGFSFNEYVNYQRIFSAQDLLKNTTKQITDIAISVGLMAHILDGVQAANWLHSAYRKLYSN